MRRPPKPESFDKFYFNKVALGEGCGCAERVIDVHEFNRQTDNHPVKRRIPLINLFRKLFTSRPA